jgi:hypothetical protein
MSDCAGRQWTVLVSLRIRRLGVRVPPSAQASDIESDQARGPAPNTIDDTDRRRKTILIGPRGWFVQYHRSGYEVLAPPARDP